MEPKVSAAILIGFSGCVCAGLLGVSGALAGNGGGLDLGVFMVRGGLAVVALGIVGAFIGAISKAANALNDKDKGGNFATRNSA